MQQATRHVSARWLGLPLGAMLILLEALAAHACMVTSHGLRSEVTLTATATVAPVPLTRYENPAYPYEIGYPRGWTVAALGPETVSFQGPGGRQIQVDVEPLPATAPKQSVAVYADATIESMRRSLANFVELQRTPVTLTNKQPAVEIDLSWGDGAGRRRTLLLFAVKDGISYTLRAEVPVGAFPSERRMLDRSLRSFTLTASD